MTLADIGVDYSCGFNDRTAWWESVLVFSKEWNVDVRYVCMFFDCYRFFALLLLLLLFSQKPKPRENTMHAE